MKDVDRSTSEHDSPEYHAAHLAFSEARIVETAANREPILDLLHAYKRDVMRAERDRRSGNAGHGSEEWHLQATASGITQVRIGTRDEIERWAKNWIENCLDAVARFDVDVARHEAKLEIQRRVAGEEKVRDPHAFLGEWK